ncbi:undecaprenyl-diphosphatase UppP [Leptonema illini]|jgi:undecaprenyl-diphosphatase|uniref:Undecaprenyl-diphosphatase n=1 Tax=Leptonema illini DSM 21528 TaxID=929563 RepID=H2CHX0_9LEPT|nr:undecaprenyl-diphosphatase UppP [Leptonema illini]EHQ06992.1 Undecaprenyl-diphosphatase [Leptonema illini DSM 21528]PKL30142.1 MAG: undecaprenyl-diphosphatase UppP [Spirochaetae bacterium HGW-Spirochaetae-10]
MSESISIPVSILLGLIQGLTEFLPVSSTAHIRIIPAFFYMPDPGAAYTAVIQLGSLVALLYYFRRDLTAFALASLKAVDSYRKGEPLSHEALMPVYLLIGTIPVSVFGLLLKDYIKGPFRSLYVIAGSLIVFAFFLFIADRIGKKDRQIKEMNWKDAVWIGLGQAFALIPGASRSGTTLTAGLLLGFDRAAAMRYSFLLSIPAIALSGFYELIKDFGELQQQGLVSLLVGTLVSVVSSYVVVAGLLRFLRTHTTMVFVVYRVAMGLFILGLLYTQVLEP